MIKLQCFLHILTLCLSGYLSTIFAEYSERDKHIRPKEISTDLVSVNFADRRTPYHPTFCNINRDN
jgi:hypothetical protein